MPGVFPTGFRNTRPGVKQKHVVKHIVAEYKNKTKIAALRIYREYCAFHSLGVFALLYEPKHAYKGYRPVDLGRIQGVPRRISFQIYVGKETDVSRSLQS